MSEIQDAGSISPREKKMYEREYKHGVDLFQKALDQTSKSENPYQKEQFEQVMNKVMEVLNQTSKALKNSDLERETKNIAEDYKNYQINPDSKSETKLRNDLQKARNSI